MQTTSVATIVKKLFTTLSVMDSGPELLSPLMSKHLPGLYHIDIRTYMESKHVTNVNACTIRLKNLVGIKYDIQAEKIFLILTFILI